MRKKQIPIEKGPDEKVVVIGMWPKDFITLDCGTRIYCLSPQKVTLFLLTKKTAYVKIGKYEPTYVEEKNKKTLQV